MVATEVVLLAAQHQPLGAIYTAERGCGTESEAEGWPQQGVPGGKKLGEHHLEGGTGGRQRVPRDEERTDDGKCHEEGLGTADASGKAEEPVQ